MMIQKRKGLSVGVCLLIVGLIASLISGCAGGGGGGGGGGDGGGGDNTPIYGGEFNFLLAADIVGWDDGIVPHYNVAHGGYQCLWSGDWAKGPAGGYGSNDCTWRLPGEINRLDNVKGYIAESYEIHDDYLIFNIRHGMHWFDKYPCNGREVTADDVVFSLERQMTLGTAYLHTNYPQVAAAMSVSKVDEDTVRIDCDSTQMAELLSLIDFMHIYPQDAVELYGNLNAWDRVIGNGPFILEEYVPASALHYVRNDDYWETYPVIGSPSDGDQLPYLDGYNVLIQPDASTQDSLFTTGQVDILPVDFDRAEVLKDSCPDANYVQYFTQGGKAILCMRIDHEGEPWADKRVRQAMQLAIDNQLMLDQLYGGQGERLYWPVGPSTEYAGAYVPLEELDDDTFEVLPGRTISVADLFGYDLELAQDLMAAAGYEEGFQAEIWVWDYYLYTDQLQVAKNMLEDINVEITIKGVDYATISSIFVGRSYEQMLYGSMSGVGTYFKGINWSGTGMWNQGYIDDPYLNDVRDQMLAAYPDEAEVDQIHAEMIPYLLEQCYVIQLCGPDSYRFWWPWVRNYSGEGSIGYYKGFGSFLQYVWIDEDLKESMGY
jgi:peptide/nickel transport system substrate-binding protein